MKRLLIIGSGFAGMYAALSDARLRDQQGVSPDTFEVAVVAPEEGGSGAAGAKLAAVITTNLRPIMRLGNRNGQARPVCEIRKPSQCGPVSPVTMLRDLCRDWCRWSPGERIGAATVVFLMVATASATLIAAHSV